MKKNGYHKHVDKKEVQKLREEIYRLEEKLDFYYENRTSEQKYKKNTEIEEIERLIESKKHKLDQILSRYKVGELEL